MILFLALFNAVFAALNLVVGINTDNWYNWFMAGFCGGVSLFLFGDIIINTK